MIISSTIDYREAARCRFPRFLFDCIDGGAYAEQTMQRNQGDLQDLALRQRVLKDVGQVDLSTRIFDESFALPIALGPVGLTGMSGPFAAQRRILQAICHPRWAWDVGILLGRAYIYALAAAGE